MAPNDLTSLLSACIYDPLSTDYGSDLGLASNKIQQKGWYVSLEIRIKRDSAFRLAHLSSSFLACCDKTSYHKGEAHVARYWGRLLAKSQRRTYAVSPATLENRILPKDIDELGRLYLGLDFKWNQAKVTKAAHFSQGISTESPHPRKPLNLEHPGQLVMPEIVLDGGTLDASFWEILS